MSDEKSVAELWEERLAEARVQVGRGLEPERLAERYDAGTREAIEQLTIQATKEVIRGSYSKLTLDDLDAAAEELAGGDHEIVTDGGTDQPSDDTDRGVPPEDYELWDEEREQYRCPVCDERVLRIGDYAECTDCGRSFYRSQDSDTDRDGGESA